MLKTPKHISEKMDLWRMGATALPQEFIDFHEEAARADLAKRDGWSVLKEEMVSDGYFDGMKVLQVIVRMPWDCDQFGEREVLVLKWHESGAWFQHAPSGGWLRAYEMITEEE